MDGFGLFFLLLILLVVFAAVGWVFWTRWRARSRGLPPPPLSAYNPFKRNTTSSNYPIGPRPSNPLTWLQDKYHALKDRAGGGGSDSGMRRGRGGARGGFGALDPDGAWDDRVDHEAETGYGPVDAAAADYEEQELSLHPTTDRYQGSGYGAHGSSNGNGNGHGVLPAYGAGAGGHHGLDGEDTMYIGGSQRGLDSRYDEEMHAGGHSRADSHNLDDDESSARANPFGDDADRSSLRPPSPSKNTGLRKSAFQESM